MAKRNHQFDETESSLQTANDAMCVHVWKPIWKLTGAASPASAQRTVMT